MMPIRAQGMVMESSYAGVLSRRLPFLCSTQQGQGGWRRAGTVARGCQNDTRKGTRPPPRKGQDPSSQLRQQ